MRVNMKQSSDYDNQFRKYPFKENMHEQITPIKQTQKTALYQSNNINKPMTSDRKILAENKILKPSKTQLEGIDKEPYLGEFQNFKPFDQKLMRMEEKSVSPDNIIKQFEREYGDIAKLTLDEINRELDNNMNEIIIMLNRRKSLIMTKRKKLKSEFFSKFEELKRSAPEDMHTEIIRQNIDDQVLQNFVQSATSLGKMQKIISSVTKDLTTNTQEKQKTEIQKSSDFWNVNKNLEGEVDNLLKRLKFYDQELEKSNAEIHDMCKNIDQIEDNIRELLIQKTEDHVKRAEPLFIQKTKTQEKLNSLIVQRSKIKDEKIGLIYKIIENLSNLKDLREERLKDLVDVFGIEEKSESSVKISYYIDFVDQLENLARIKENIHQQEMQEDQITQELDKIFKEVFEQSDSLFTELIRKQSEEAKVYAEYSNNLDKRLQMHRAIEFFMSQANLTGIAHLDIKDILKKFKENILFLKPLVEEDVAIRQGLQKTQETISTFNHILKVTECEKERRKELIALLEECQRLKSEENNKTDQIRNIELEITKKIQQKTNLEEDLENILSDADLEQYKKLGNFIKNLENEINQLQVKKKKILLELEDLQNEVIKQMNIIKTEYDDIIKEILPNNLMNTYDFQKANDIKHVKNYLKKTFTRMGIHFEDFKQM